MTRQGRTYEAVFFSSEEFPDEELFCAWHYCHVIEEGPPENFFIATVAGENVDAVEDSGIEEAESIDPALFDARNSVEDIKFV